MNTATTESSSSTVGAIITTGGLGVKLNANAGGTLIVKGTADITGTARATGNVGIGGAPDAGSTYALKVYGGVQDTGAFDTSSDRRWKRNIVQLQGGLAKVLNMTGAREIDCKKDLGCRQFAPCANDECEKTKAVEALFATMDRTSYTTSWTNTRGALTLTHRIFHEYTYEEQYVTAQRAQYIGEIMAGDNEREGLHFDLAIPNSSLASAQVWFY
jgi:hypothetical protein